MAVRIRSGSKTVICAAKSEARPNDGYIDDGLHYILAEELRVLSVYAHTTEGADLWAFHEPTVERREEPSELGYLLRRLPWKRPFTVFENRSICAANGRVIIRTRSIAGAKALCDLLNQYPEVPDGQS